MKDTLVPRVGGVPVKFADPDGQVPSIVEGSQRHVLQLALVTKNQREGGFPTEYRQLVDHLKQDDHEEVVGHREPEHARGERVL